MFFGHHDARVDCPNYRALKQDEIRLLVLEPGSGRSTLRASLEAVSLRNPPTYSAISYVWGDPKFTHRIVLPGGPLRITASLHGALVAFRDANRKIRLWADAICINQKDKDGELNHQLRLMAPIYRRAYQVLVWLGPSTRSDSLAFASIHILSTLRGRIEHVPWLFEEAQGRQLIDCFSQALNGYRKLFRCPCCTASYKIPQASPSDAFSTLARVWEKKWFWRIWTFQESILPRRCIFFCGALHASREQIASAAQMHDKLCDSLDNGRQHPCLTSHRQDKEMAAYIHNNLQFRRCAWLGWSKQRPREFLFEVLFLHSAGMATRYICDIVYGVRGLSFLDNERSLDDYSSMQPHELFHKVSIAALRLKSNERVGPACVLAMAGTNTTEPPRRVGYPSWAMEIDKFRREAAIKLSYYEPVLERPYAGGPCKRMPVYIAPNDLSVCCVQGIRNSKVAGILEKSQWPGKTYYDNNLTRDTIFNVYLQKQLLPWYIRCRHYAFATRTVHKNLEQTFFQLLVQGQVDEKLTADLSSLTRRFKTHLNRAYKDSYDQNARPTLPFPDLYLDDVARDLSPFLTPNLYKIQVDYRRNLCVTQEGRLAWVPESTKAGDEVWLVKGAPFPFVLGDVGKGCKRLVGDAYLHEAQSGEAWPRDERGLQEIKIV